MEDHPHIHGEHKFSSKWACGSKGSPPYTWGAPICGQQFSTLLRITPIYMGSTGMVSIILVNSWDHPHIHGEHNPVVVLLHQL